MLAVTRRGKPVQETLEVLSGEEAVLRRGIQEVKDGKAISWEEAQAGL